jgi:hypothetical protein
MDVKLICQTVGVALTSRLNTAKEKQPYEAQNTLVILSYADPFASAEDR